MVENRANHLKLLTEKAEYLSEAISEIKHYILEIQILEIVLLQYLVIKQLEIELTPRIRNI